MYLFLNSHTDTCGYCVDKWDHHCSVLGICVGGNNKRWFVAFMLSVLLNIFMYNISAFIHLRMDGCLTPSSANKCWARPDPYFMVLGVLLFSWIGFGLTFFWAYHAVILLLDITQKDLVGYSGMM